MFLMSRSKSALVTSSPFTRASTSGSSPAPAWAAPAAGGVCAAGVWAEAVCSAAGPFWQAAQEQRGERAGHRSRTRMCTRHVLNMNRMIGAVSEPAMDQMVTQSFELFRRLELVSVRGVARFRASADSEAVEQTHLGRLGAREEGLAEDARAARRGELAGVAVDVDEGDALRRVERRCSARPASARDMNGGPDRQRRLRAAQAERLVVVEPDPDHRQQLRREADEPGVAQVVGRAGLAGGVEREAGGARAARRCPR